MGLIVDSIMSVHWEACLGCINALEVSEHVGWEMIGDDCLISVA